MSAPLCDLEEEYSNRKKKIKVEQVLGTQYYTRERRRRRSKKQQQKQKTIG